MPEGGCAEWKHVAALYQVDKQSALRLCPKLTDNHIFLPFGKKMKVSYAAQVLSRSAAAAMKTYISSGGIEEEAQGTAAFIEKVDELWDALNCHTYRNEDFGDENVFVNYLNWIKQLTFVDGEGRFKETLPFKRCLAITLSAFASMIPFLLEEGHASICVRRINQDAIENFFSVMRYGHGSFHSHLDFLKGLQNLRLASAACVQNSKGGGNCEAVADQIFVDEGTEWKCFSLSIVANLLPISFRSAPNNDEPSTVFQLQRRRRS